MTKKLTGDTRGQGRLAGCLQRRERTSKGAANTGEAVRGVPSHANKEEKRHGGILYVYSLTYRSMQTLPPPPQPIPIYNQHPMCHVHV